MHRSLYTLLLAALLLLIEPGLSRGQEPGRGTRRPNIVFLLSDDHSAAAISAYGSAINQTPNLDRLAAQGMLFENTFCTNAICAPSRAVVLTGKFSPLNGVRDNAARFDGSQATLPKLLGAAGYESALIGKWHLKTDPTGFDHWDVLPDQGRYYNPDFDSPAGRRQIEGYVTDITTDLAIEWLQGRNDKQRPFLLMCQHKAPHRPWMPGPEELELYRGVEFAEPETLFDDYATRSAAAQNQEMEIARHLTLFYDLQVPPLDPDAELEGPDRWAASELERMTEEQRERFLGAFAEENAAFRAADLEGADLVRWKYQRYLRNYLRCVAGVDRNVGRLLDWLEANGLAENTIVIYSSDQGFYLGEHGWYDKRFMYEPSLRMPLIVRWPGVVKPGSRDRHLTQNVDFAETLLEAAGVEIPADMQGHSLVPLLCGESPLDWRQSVYYEYFEQGIHNVEPHFGVRTLRHKLIRFPGIDAWELYDLETDPQETHNRWGEPALRSLQGELTRELTRLRTLYGDPE